MLGAQRLSGPKENGTAKQLIENRLGHREYVGGSGLAQRLVWGAVRIHGGTDKHRGIEDNQRVRSAL